MISHQKRFIFFHNSRTGGTSIERALSEYCEYGVRDKTASPEYRKHALLPLIKKNLGDELFYAYFKFAFVRNPYDRLYSKYKWGVDICTDYQGISELGISLDDWKNSQFIEWAKTAYFDKKLYEKRPTWGPQNRLIFDYSKGEYMVDFIGRFETLSDDFSNIARHLNVSNDLPRIYSTNRTSTYQDHYDDELIGMVQELFYEDIREFGYQF